MTFPKKLRSIAQRGALGVWFGAMLLLGAILLARHVVALPAPAGDDHRVSGALAKLRGARPGGWMSVHVLYAECRCSQRVVDHLLATARPGDLHEVVLWVGQAAPRPELVARFDVHVLQRAELGRYGIESAPLLVVLDPENTIRYSGGYTTRKQGPVIEDLEILAEARRGGVLASLPVFGCAVSERLNRMIPSLPVL